MTMNHTPGPWIVGRKLATELHLSVHEAAGWTIADCDMRVRPTAENEANARFIALAPVIESVAIALLKACELGREILEDPVKSKSDVWIYKAWLALDTSITLAQAILPTEQESQQ